jgi:hypothetical protein
VIEGLVSCIGNWLVVVLLEVLASPRQLDGEHQSSIVLQSELFLLRVLHHVSMHLGILDPWPKGVTGKERCLLSKLVPVPWGSAVRGDWPSALVRWNLVGS